MIQSLPFGPFTLPIVPVFAILAVIIGLDVAARVGRRFGLHADNTWNTGMIALVACLIVARLWNVIQFWEVYASEPLLIVSVRPSGFYWPAGIGAAIVAGYLYLLRKALDPLAIAAAFAVGALAGGAVQSISHFLTGNLLGVISNVPWALDYFFEPRHPVALYELIGLFALLIFVQLIARRNQPGRTVWWVIFGWSVLLLITRAFVAEPVTFSGFRTVQIAALITALISAWQLAVPSAPSPSAALSTDAGS